MQRFQHINSKGFTLSAVSQISHFDDDDDDNKDNNKGRNTEWPYSATNEGSGSDNGEWLVSTTKFKYVDMWPSDNASAKNWKFSSS